MNNISQISVTLDIATCAWLIYFYCLKAIKCWPGEVIKEILC